MEGLSPLLERILVEVQQHIARDWARRIRIQPDRIHLKAVHHVERGIVGCFDQWRVVQQVQQTDKT